MPPKVERPRAHYPDVKKRAYKMNILKTYITIPVEGQPFIDAVIHKKNTGMILKHLWKATESNDITTIDCPLVIHPMFVQESPRWAMVDRMIRAKQGVNVWAVSDPMAYTANAAIILTDPRTRFSGCPHLMGNVVLELTPAAMAKFCPDADMLRLVMPTKAQQEEDDGMADFEKECRRLGYDMSRFEPFCQVYRKVATL